MSTSCAFLPCAGLGTRMGDIGKKIPKPLWPIFDQSLVEVQMCYANSLGIKDFCINTHHLSEKLESHFKNKRNFQLDLFYEERLLGSGGCFHNLVDKGVRSENVFIFNPDSFLILSDEDWKSFFELSRKNSQILIAVPCKRDDPYNRLEIKGHKLQKIVPPSSEAPPITYSGFGKVSLSEIKAEEKVSGFFESVAIPGENGPVIFNPRDSFEFWDFGTLKSYKVNILKLMSEDSGLRRLLISFGALNPDRLGVRSYNSKHAGVINFSGRELNSSEPGIFLSQDGVEYKIPL